MPPCTYPILLPSNDRSCDLLSSSFEWPVDWRACDQKSRWPSRKRGRRLERQAAVIPTAASIQVHTTKGTWLSLVVSTSVQKYAYHRGGGHAQVMSGPEWVNWIMATSRMISKIKVLLLTLEMVWCSRGDEGECTRYQRGKRRKEEFSGLWKPAATKPASVAWLARQHR